MTDNHVTAADILKHRCRHFTRVSAARLGGGILRTEHDRTTRDLSADLRQVNKRRAEQNLGGGGFAGPRKNA